MMSLAFFSYCLKNIDRKATLKILNILLAYNEIEHLGLSVTLA